MMEWVILGLSLLLFLISLGMLFFGMRACRNARNPVALRNELLRAAGQLLDMTYFSCSVDGVPDKEVSDGRFWGRDRDGKILSREKWIVAEDLPEFLSVWRKMLTEKTLPRMTVGYRAGLNGQVDFFEMRVERRRNPVNDQEELFGLIRNVTAVKLEQEKMRETNLLLLAILDQLPGMIVVRDIGNDFRYVVWNKSAESVTGCLADQILGKNNREIEVLKDYAEDIYQRDLKTLKDGSLRSDMRLSLPTGILEIKVYSMLLGEGPSAKILTMALDVTEEKRLECERQKIMDDLADYAEQQRLLNVLLEWITVDEKDDRTAMNKVLKEISGRLGAAGGYLFCADEATGNVLPWMEWCEPGSSPLLKSEPVLFFAEDKLCKTTILRHRIAHVKEDDVAGRELLNILGCRAVSVAGIWLDKRLWGYLAFGFTGEKAELSDQERTMLASAAHMVEIVQSRRRNHEELSRIESEKRLIIDQIKIPVMLFDANLKLIRVNNAAVEVAGIPEEEIYDRPCFCSFCGGEDWNKDCPMIRASNDLCEHSQEIKIRERTYLISAYPVVVDGKLVNVLKTLIDVTDFNNVRRQLTQALLDTQSANKAKSFFLATMSHELRTPLNAVIGFSELLSDSDMSEEERLDAVESINLAGKSLLSLINDVLDLSKIEAEQMNIIPHPTDVLALCREIEAIFRHKLEGKKLLFVIECRQELPELLLDSLRLRQILLNLIGNAIKFTDRGSIRITIEFVPLSVRQGVLTLHVADTGIGVKPEFQQQIFDPFVQDDAVQGTRGHGGTGLGLAISSRLARRMGGSLRLESVYGEGSDFILELENVEFIASAGVAADASLVAQVADTPQGCRGRILVVDDVEMNLKVLSAMLRSLHYDVMTAGSGREALDCLGREMPDLILTDLWMPEMNGEDFVLELRKNPCWREVKVVAVTADTEADGNFDVGLFDGLLLKPVTLKKLKKIIDMKSAEGNV